MLPEPMELKLAASARNSLSWSEDGELAIAAGEEVHILLPNHSEDASEKPWIEIYFSINHFSEQEWPLVTVPSSTDGLFIGKEQRTPVVSALEWSAPGLARHERSVLAVLTTNGFLSIWVPGLVPTSAGHWSKRLSVNLVIAEHLKESSKRELIKAFAWGHWQDHDRSQTLAVISEDAIYVLKIWRTGGDIQGEVIVSEELEKAEPAEFLRDLIQRNYRGSYVTWQHQRGDVEECGDETAVSLLHAINGGYLKTWEFTMQSEGRGGTSSLLKLPQKFPAHGPLCVQGSMLFYFDSSMLKMLESFVRSDELIPKSVSTLTQWDLADAIVPFGLSDNRLDLAVMQPLNLLSFTHIDRVNDRFVENCSSTQPESEQLSVFAKHLKAGLDAFSSEHGLNGPVRSKLHGIATYGKKKQILASLVSYWPTQQIVYHIKAHDKIRLILTHSSLEAGASLASDSDLRLPWQQPHEAKNDELPGSAVLLLLRNSTNRSSEWKQLVLLQLCAYISLADGHGVDTVLELLSNSDEPWANEIKFSMALSDSDTDISSSVRSVIETSIKESPDAVEYCTIPGCSKPLFFEKDRKVANTAICTGAGHTYGEFNDPITAAL